MCVCPHARHEKSVVMASAPHYAVRAQAERLEARHSHLASAAAATHDALSAARARLDNEFDNLKQTVAATVRFMPPERIDAAYAKCEADIVASIQKMRAALGALAILSQRVHDEATTELRTRICALNAKDADIVDVDASKSGCAGTVPAVTDTDEATHAVDELASFADARLTVIRNLAIACPWVTYDLYTLEERMRSPACDKHEAAAIADVIKLMPPDAWA